MSEKGEGDPAPAVSLPLCPASAAQGQADLGWVGAERAEQGVGTHPPAGGREGS